MHEVQVWQDLLVGKGLAAAVDALEAYSMSCEDEVSLLRKTDLSTLDIQSKPLHENTRIGEFLCVCVCVYSGLKHMRIQLVLACLPNTGIPQGLQLT